MTNEQFFVPLVSLMVRQTLGERERERALTFEFLLTIMSLTIIDAQLSSILTMEFIFE